MADTARESLSKALLFAFGAAYSTAEGIKSFVGDMVKRGDVTRNEAEGLVKDLVERGKQAQTDINQRIARGVADYLKSAGIPSREEFEQLKARVEKLEPKPTQRKTQAAE